MHIYINIYVCIHRQYLHICIHVFAPHFIVNPTVLYHGKVFDSVPICVYIYV